MKALLPSLLLLAALSASAQEASPDLQAQLEAVRALEEAWLAFYRGDLQEAKARFLRLQEGQPDQSSAALGLGRTLLKLGELQAGRQQLQGALPSLDSPLELTDLGEEVLESDPELAEQIFSRALDRGGGAGAQLGRARALEELGQHQAASAALERAAALAPGGAASLQGLRDRVKAQGFAEAGDFAGLAALRGQNPTQELLSLTRLLQRRMLLAQGTRISLRVSPLFDSNAIAIPDRAILPGDIPREPTFGVAVGAGIEQRLAETQGYELALLADAAEGAYFDSDIPDSLQLSLGLAWQPKVSALPPPEPARVEWVLSYQASEGLLDYEHFLLSHRASASTFLNWSQTQQSALSLGAAFELYDETPTRRALDRDGVALTLELTHTLVFPGLNNLRVQPLLGGRSEFRDGSDFDMEGAGAGLSVGGPLPGDLSWQVSCAWRRERYLHPNTLLFLQDEREDDVFLASAALSVPLSAFVTLTLSYLLIDRSSNVEEYDYTANKLAFSLAWDLPW